MTTRTRRKVSHHKESYCRECQTVRPYKLTPDRYWECRECGFAIECVECGGTMHARHRCGGERSA